MYALKIHGLSAPTSRESFRKLVTQHLEEPTLRHIACVHCDRAFEGRTSTRQGWLRTQQFGFCEMCYEGLRKHHQANPEARPC